ncbi:GNAT family N-acetyltransferase [Roseisalinus antarcticus]|uniref:N-acetyltransferase domain-containing protein n=1 Tax=Roseisalinus antarcticus TaxID=254357 RepID=A0A1Y5RPQ5_9RHOB|nr:GNAT family N-acetyltransferase [Roseisalinus antarcticus]SLN21432.1 hypothetical protein ROA7023_00560 [Roseisalinus antarcticus]
MIRVVPPDLPTVEAFLRARALRAMFPLANLARYGLDGGHDNAPAIWAAWTGGAVTDVLAVTRGGTVLPALPSRNWAEAAAVLSGGRIAAVIGPTDEVRPLIAAAGLRGATTLDRDEPHFALDLEALDVPDGPGVLMPLREVDLGQVIEWRKAYAIETLGTPADRADLDARRDVDAFLEAGSHRVLVEDGRLLSMTGFNADIGNVVQVGGVYTPPELRGRHHARRAVALHLAEARARGARRAALFAASAGSAHLYEAIGFGRIGDFTLCLYQEPVHV